MARLGASNPSRLATDIPRAVLASYANLQQSAPGPIGCRQETV